MKTILFNTQTSKTEGRIREGSFNGIWNSALSKEPGWTPEHIVELEVFFTDSPEFDPETQTASFVWEADTEAKTYTRVWTVTDLTQEEIDRRDALETWKYPNWAKRIVAPIALVLDDIGIKMYGWFQLNGFPVDKSDEETVHLYCNTILEEHQDIVQALGESIYIEDRPEILDPYVEELPEELEE